MRSTTRARLPIARHAMDSPSLPWGATMHDGEWIASTHVIGWVFGWKTIIGLEHRDMVNATL